MYRVQVENRGDGEMVERGHRKTAMNAECLFNVKHTWMLKHGWSACRTCSRGSLVLLFGWHDTLIGLCKSNVEGLSYGGRPNNAHQLQLSYLHSCILPRKIELYIKIYKVFLF